MDYSKWAEEYWDAANKIGEVINSLTIEIKNTNNISKKHELKMKRESYVAIEIDMINTAKKLETKRDKITLKNNNKKLDVEE